MTERTIEVGGETLRAGDTVIVFDGNSQKEREITEIGTKRVHIESLGHRPTPYGIETRKSLQGQYTSYFRTRTEVAEYAHRDALRAQLQNLGMDFTTSFLGKGERYPVEALEKIVEILEAHPSK